MARVFKISPQTLSEAIDKGLAAAGYEVEKLGRKTAVIRKGDQTMKVAVRTSRDRYIGSPPSGGALHRSDIAAFVIGAVNSIESPTSVKVHLIPRTEVLRRWEARRAARRAAGYTLGPGPSFIALYKSDDAGPGSGLGDEFEPIAEINIDGLSADQPLAAADIQVVEGIAPHTLRGEVGAGSDGIDRFKQDVVDSAEKWLRFDPARAKIDIHITIDIRPG
jgi:hypothetical protein